MLTSESTTTSLLISESVELSAALTATLASGADLRVLFIKGPAAVAAGVRPQRASADIDVLVHPEDTNKLLALLAERGWKKRPFADGVGIPMHSHTLYHPNWPSDIDVHFRFPGLDADPGESFDVLAQNCANHSFSGVSAPTPCHAGMALIQITHALRNLHLEDSRSSASQKDYAFLLDQTESLRWEELLAVMKGTKSLAAMKPFLYEAYPTLARDLVFPTPSEDWQSRTATRYRGTHRLVLLQRASWRNKPAIIYRSLFPPREHLAAKNLELLDAKYSTLVKYQLSRIFLFLRLMPQAAQESKRRIIQSEGDQFPKRDNS
ncbi:hypothetical protein CQ018_17385 [Arthrobacter sp. MYb227]|uniref:nucleotidyltransferase family protein n=1 Tax=Arthrobacter sp. MYb227 TaxID=1848601 RepID=UPI000CFE1110|nr:nucleotidyltransferase family protein [Arthrobacter sp. MYb227]PQZ87718.1 hypothetical protein CQ018_17385 [Arthrobacter sp. MYb227]